MTAPRELKARTSIIPPRHEVFVGWRNAQTNWLVRVDRGLHRLPHLPTTTRNLKNVIESNAYLGQPGKVCVAVEGRILQAFFHFDELNDLIREGLIEYAPWVPAEKFPLRVIPRARKSLANEVRLRVSH